MKSAMPFVAMFALIACSVAFPAPASTAPDSDLLAVNDRLKITVDDLTGPGVTSAWTPLVDSDGTLKMPLIPAVQVAGLSFAQTEQKLTQAYRDANLISSAVIHAQRIETAAAPATGRGPLNVGDPVICHIVDLAGPGVESRIKQTIGNDGQINLPNIDNLKIAGESESAAAIAIANAFRDANLISQAQVELVRDSAK